MQRSGSAVGPLTLKIRYPDNAHQACAAPGYPLVSPELILLCDADVRYILFSSGSVGELMKRFSGCFVSYLGSHLEPPFC